MKNAKWTPEAAARLRAEYPARPNAELCIEFDCTEFALVAAARRFGARKTPAYLAKLPRGHCVPRKRQAFLAACAELLALPTGARLSEMAAHAGVEPMNAKCFLHKAVRAGDVFSAGCHAHMRYFATAEGAAAGALLVAALMAKRHEQACERRRTRDREKYSPKPPRQKALKPPKVARVKKVAAPKAPKPPKVPKQRVPVLRKAGSSIRSEASPPKIGPARRNEPADMSRAKVTRLPTPPCRYAVPDEYRGAFSLAGIGRDVQTGNAWSHA